jgi:hypothetical protein
MALAAFGTQVEEQALEALARMEAAGTPVEELARLARLHGLVAEVQETTWRACGASSPEEGCLWPTSTGRSST